MLTAFRSGWQVQVLECGDTGEAATPPYKHVHPPPAACCSKPGCAPYCAVAWLLGDQQKELEAVLALPEVQAAAQQLASQAWQLAPTAVVCKAGQRAHTIWQPAGCSHAATAKGLG